MSDDWDDLRFVLAVAETGTVSGAARRLGVNHATVLRRIAQFEERVGTVVFDKTPRGYTLAPDVMRLLEATRDVDRAVQSVGRILAGARAPLQGEVRVTSTDSFCQILLPPILSRIAEVAPDLRVRLFSSNAYADFGRVQADLTVRPTLSLPPDMAGERVASLDFCVYQGRGATSVQWLGLSGALERTAPARWMADRVAPEDVGDEADSFMVLAELAARGRGRVILPRFVGEADPRLERLEGLLPPMAVDVWVASHTDMAEVPRIQLVRRLLVREFAVEAERRPEAVSKV